MDSNKKGITDLIHPVSKRALSLITLTLFLFTSFFILNQTAEAQQLVCPLRAIQQITNQQGASEQPSISADGTRIAMESRGNFNGGNPNAVDQIWIANAITGGFIQITDDPATSSFDPSLSADATLVAFESNADHTGMNPDGNQEIFLGNATTGVITQITDTGGGTFNRDPSISGNGLFIAFESDADHTGMNMDGNQEIFLANVTTGTITQITDTMGPAENHDASINADATLIAFQSDANIGGGNLDGSAEIFLFDTTTGTFTQITFTMAPANARGPAISADGTRIGFRSDANFNGGNPEGNSELWIFDTNTAMLTQVTSTPTGFNTDPSLNANGLFVAFRSSGNFNGQNPGGVTQIWIFDSTTGIITPITLNTANFSERPSISADGSRIAFESNANINGQNSFPGVDQIWITTCLNPMMARNIPTLSEWGLIAMAGALGLIGLFAIRRRTAFVN